MEPLFWQLVNRTAETQFIFNLFHLLLAGLTLLVWLHQLRTPRPEPQVQRTWLLAGELPAPGIAFALGTLHFGLEFFFRKLLGWRSLGLLVVLGVNRLMRLRAPASCCHPPFSGGAPVSDTTCGPLRNWQLHFYLHT
jgi:hypothetical protein